MTPTWPIAKKKKKRTKTGSDMHHFYSTLTLPVGFFGSLFTVLGFVAFMRENDLDLHVQFVAWLNFELGDITGPLLGTSCEDDVGLTKYLKLVMLAVKIHNKLF